MLPQYEILGLAGRGGMGAVYKGRQRSLERDVAIKILPETLAAGAGEGGEGGVNAFVERFKLEARAMASLDHPAILSVYDFGQTGQGQLYLVIEFVDGVDVHRYLQDYGGRLPESHAVKGVRQKLHYFLFRFHLEMVLGSSASFLPLKR